MPYVTTEFAVVGPSESLRAAVDKYGIDVSVLCPGPVDTNIPQSTRSADGGLFEGAAAHLAGGIAGQPLVGDPPA